MFPAWIFFYFLAISYRLGIKDTNVKQNYKEMDRQNNENSISEMLVTCDKERWLFALKVYIWV